MKRLEFHYHMTIQFDIPVKNHHFTLKCLPHSDLHQIVEKLDYVVFPNYFISRSVDSFQNECIYGFCENEHEYFMVDVKGIVRTSLGNGFDAVGAAEGDCVFKYQTTQTMPGHKLVEYHRAMKEELLQSFGRGEEGNVRSTALFYMQRLYECFAYQSGSTQITTTAEEAFTIQKGVCQDYAHILLSLLRMDQIPCRYVTGMMIGEGFSHAWVEVLTQEGWLALDPTNGRLVDAGYVSIARGRDYKDCLLNQGVFTGCERQAAQKQDIKVEVREIG